MEKDKKNNKNDQELPFILNFLEVYKGASSPTTSGTWDSIDSSDKD